MNNEEKNIYVKRQITNALLTLLEQSGSKPEYDNTWAYITAFIAYGTYGWIEEWVARGMQESGEEMTALLSAHGMR